MFGWLKGMFGGSENPGEALEKEFFSSVVGVSHRNSNRLSRQKIIREDLYSTTKLRLVLEENNKHDSNAVALFIPDGKQIGYLNSRLAADVRKWLHEGCRVEVKVSEITGGVTEKEMQGVNIRIRVYGKAG